MSVYVSTSCLVNPCNVFGVLETYGRAGLGKVELGSRHKHVAGLAPGNFRQYDSDFLVHHYFPPPEKPIIVNLASQDPSILEQSRMHISGAIDFCSNLGTRLFTFHAGFCLDPDNRFRFSKDQPFDYEAAFNTFIESVDEMNCYAQQRGIRIAIENNVLAEYNLANGHDQFLLLCRAEEFERLWDRVPSANIGMLLDLGHLKVTSHWLQFDRYEFIDRIKDRVFALHLHENNGQVDEHAELDKTSWCWQVICSKCFGRLPIILESSGLDIEQIIQQVCLMEDILGNG